MSKGSFYTCFKRKEDIVEEIAHTNFYDMRARSRELQGDVSDKMSAFLTESMKYIVRAGLKLAQQRMKCGAEPELTKDVSNKFAYDMSVIREILDAEAQSGELAPETPVGKICQFVTVEYYGAVACWGHYGRGRLTQQGCLPLRELFGLNRRSFVWRNFTSDKLAAMRTESIPFRRLLSSFFSLLSLTLFLSRVSGLLIRRFFSL